MTSDTKRLKGTNDSLGAGSGRTATLSDRAVDLVSVLRRPPVWSTLLLGACFWATFLSGPWAHETVDDLRLYVQDAHAFLAGHLPYRSQPFEYPPLAAPVLAVSGVFGTGLLAYRATFAVLMFLFAAVSLVMTGKLARLTGGGQRLALLVTAVSPLLVGALIRNRFDVSAVAPMLAALVLMLSGRRKWGFAMLGIAVGVKGFPLVIAPVALAWVWARDGRRAATECAGVLAAAVAIPFAIAAGLSLHGLESSVRFQTSRAVEIESTPASVLYALAHIGFRHPVVIWSARSYGLSDPASGVVSTLTDLVTIGIIALVSLRVWRNPGPRELVLGALASVAAFVAFGKVFSPQYVIWLVPLLALSVAWGMYGIAAATTGALLFTLVEYPDHLYQVVGLQNRWLGFVGVRNLLVVAAVLLCARTLRAPQASRNTGALRRAATGRLRLLPASWTAATRLPQHGRIGANQTD